MGGCNIVDQHAMGRILRSTAATYTGVYNLIRAAFSKQHGGVQSSYFSFNVPGGRCETFHGTGAIALQMHFMPGASVVCSDCSGARFSEEALGIKYHGLNIADILHMTFSGAMQVFENEPKIHSIISVICDLGLGYLRLGQPANTFSGGEAQRVSLAGRLLARGRRHTLYILDEPTVGLHASDVDQLYRVLRRLVSAGHSVIIIEHNPILIAKSDWIIELGRGGGDAGGAVVAVGTQEEVRANQASLIKNYI